MGEEAASTWERNSRAVLARAWESGNGAAEIGKSCGICVHMFSTMDSIQTPETEAGI